MYLFHISATQEPFKQAKVGDDPRGAAEAWGGGVQHWTPVRPHTVGQEQHAGPHQLQKQQEASRPCQSFRQVGHKAEFCACHRVLLFNMNGIFTSISV